MNKIRGDDLSAKMWDAVVKKDESEIKLVILRAMELFLENKFSKEDLSGLAILYVVVPIHEKDLTEINFEDDKLRYVLEELSAIETKPDERALLDARRFIAYLNDEDYEKIS